MKTIEAATALNDIVQNMKMTDASASKQEVIANLDHNLTQFSKLNEQYVKLYADNYSMYNKYNLKYKSCKATHSKKYFEKKLARYKDNLLAIVNKMAIVDTSVKNLTATKEKILKDAIDTVSKDTE